MSRWILLGAMLAVVGCGGDDDGAPDAMAALDASAVDAGLDAASGQDADATDADATDADVTDADVTDADVTDADVESDAGAEDSGAADAGASDAGADGGPGVDAGPGACHDLDFGRAAVPIRQVSAAELPPATGGTITSGTYDAVDALIAGTTTGSFRATWHFDATTIDQIQQISLPAPGAVVPRTFAWSTSGNQLTRTPPAPTTGCRS